MMSSARTRWGLFIALVLAASAGVAAESAAPAAQPQSWSPQKVIEARNAGKKVFVAFRADWCVTCRVNEITVFRGRGVHAALAAPDVVYLVADYTGKSDPAIKNELEYYQAGILPMYLVYRPDLRRPQVLPKMLGKKEIVAALR